jgi:selenocysteine-specific elongation factor
MKGRPPGLLRVGVTPDVVMMVCTAGHVDHGKTSLVKLLTGCNTDRLKIEQERGMTIELGFAPCLLGGELCVGIVDVPGHEKFVRNMVAGVSGIDLTILVIAADDGIMPQTVEHFQIMDLLGVRAGIIALTKTDLVAPERVAEVRNEIESYFKDTFLADAPICPLSSETGDGVFDFYELLVARIRAVVKQRRRGVFRMPVERVFAQKGFGQVVTGIAIDGAVAVGDEVELLPGGQRGRVRAIQQFLRSREEGAYGQCLALNVPEFSKQPPVRGQVLCKPCWLRPTKELYVSLKAVGGSERPLTHAESVKVHTGTAETMGRVYLLEGKALRENEKGFALISLNEPVAVAVHDRFILRRPSPATTIGGGEVLQVPQGHIRPKKPELVKALGEYSAFIAGVDPASDEGIERDVAYALRARWRHGVTVADLARDLLVPENVIEPALKRMPGVTWLSANCAIAAEAYESRAAEVRAKLDEAERGQNLNQTLAQLRQAFKEWPAALWSCVQADLEKEGKLSVRGGRVVLAQGFERLPAADRALAERLVQVYDETEFQSPRPEELPAMVNAPERNVNRLLDYLCSEGKLVRVAKNVVLSGGTFRKAQDIVVRTIREKGSLDSADFKYALGSTRKYALAILDFMDARRITVRTENIRRLAADYQRKLI